ncbi:hypothetical protein [Phytoactinopolyspora limicola]|uniref:hypothetical protein n=1 Tax=Phytoactinopolyspora limicola TaxID=2715536 RepID=UPI0014086574|nr:hypothetical protein [Phytoactinopolyspora limicola]
MLISSVWRGKSFWWFTLGLLLGGVAIAIVVQAVGGLLVDPFAPSTVVVTVLIVTYSIAAGHELGIVRLPLPQNARQVPESIVNDGPTYGALHFGFEMGTGVRTYMTTSLPHALAAGILLAASWPDALVAGLAFGAGRSLMPASRRARADDMAWDSNLAQAERRIKIIALASTAVCVVAIINRMLA